MTSPLKIRRAISEDSAAISKLLYECFAEFAPLYTPQGFAATTPAAEQVMTRMNEGPLWIAVLGDDVVGSVGAVAKGRSLYIRGMGVLPSARGSGVGAQLLAQVERWAAECGSTRLFLSTTPFLHAAIRLYERYGFRRTCDGDHDLFGTPLLTMEKLIAPGD
jgi:GNAT superfamily N-acetyltransferase